MDVDPVDWLLLDEEFKEEEEELFLDEDWDELDEEDVYAEALTELFVVAVTFFELLVTLPLGEQLQNISATNVANPVW